MSSRSLISLPRLVLCWLWLDIGRVSALRNVELSVAHDETEEVVKNEGAVLWLLLQELLRESVDMELRPGVSVFLVLLFCLAIEGVGDSSSWMIVLIEVEFEIVESLWLVESRR